PPKRKVLDLIEQRKSPSRRERQRTEASKVKTVEDAKREALDLFSDDGKKKRTARKSAKPVIPAISKVLGEKDPTLVPEPPATPPAPAPATAASGDEPSADGDNVISIKPPIIVSELAARMNLKPFQLLADLIKLQIFVA